MADTVSTWDDLPDLNSYSVKHALSKTLVVMLVYGYSVTGKRQYAYVAVKGDKVAELREAVFSGNFDVSKYGHIIRWGAGDPPEAVMREMEEKYGFNHAKGVLVPRDESEL